MRLRNRECFAMQCFAEQRLIKPNLIGNNITKHHIATHRLFYVVYDQSNGTVLDNTCEYQKQLNHTEQNMKES